MKRPKRGGRYWPYGALQARNTVLEQTAQLDVMLSDLEPHIDQVQARLESISRANTTNNRDLIRIATEAGLTQIRDIQRDVARMHTMIIRMHAAMQALQQEAAPDDTDTSEY